MHHPCEAVVAVVVVDVLRALPPSTPHCIASDSNAGEKAGELQMFFILRAVRPGARSFARGPARLCAENGTRLRCDDWPLNWYSAAVAGLAGTQPARWSGQVCVLRGMSLDFTDRPKHTHKQTSEPFQVAFPGGHVEAGESDDAAVAREVRHGAEQSHCGAISNAQCAQSRDASRS